MGGVLAACALPTSSSNCSNYCCTGVRGTVHGVVCCCGMDIPQHETEQMDTLTYYHTYS